MRGGGWEDDSEGEEAVTLRLCLGIILYLDMIWLPLCGLGLDGTLPLPGAGTAWPLHLCSGCPHGLLPGLQTPRHFHTCPCILLSAIPYLPSLLLCAPQACACHLPMLPPSLPCSCIPTLLLLPTLTASRLAPTHTLPASSPSMCLACASCHPRRGTSLLASWLSTPDQRTGLPSICIKIHCDWSLPYPPHCLPV